MWSSGAWGRHRHPEGPPGSRGSSRRPCNLQGQDLVRLTFACPKCHVSKSSHTFCKARKVSSGRVCSTTVSVEPLSGRLVNPKRPLAASRAPPCGCARPDSEASRAASSPRTGHFRVPCCQLEPAGPSLSSSPRQPRGQVRSGDPWPLTAATVTGRCRIRLLGRDCFGKGGGDPGLARP